MENYKIEIISGVVAIVIAIIGGSIYSVKKSKSRDTKTGQNNITVKGNKNKIVGGDDNSNK